MKKTFYISLITILFLISLNAISDTFPLYTGRNLTQIGTVTVTDDSNNLYITYTTDSGWVMTATHLEVKTSLEAIPQANGNPIPGRFTYKTSHNPPVSVYTYTIPQSWQKGTKLYIATHAEVKNCQGVMSSILDGPLGITNMKLHANGVSAYVDVEILDSQVDGLSPGLYGAYCLNVNQTIGYNQYMIYVEPSYSPNYSILLGAIEIPDNLDLINYVLNNYWVGKPSPGGYGNYVMFDIQKAIWILVTLLQGSMPFDYNDNSLQERVDEIVADALANGNGYIPPQGGVYGVVIIPIDEWNGDIEWVAQPLIIVLPVPKYECKCETAWGGTLPFPGKNWAVYFTYNIQNGTDDKTTGNNNNNNNSNKKKKK